MTVGKSHSELLQAQHAPYMQDANTDVIGGPWRLCPGFDLRLINLEPGNNDAAGKGVSGEDERSGEPIQEIPMVSSSD